MDKDHRDFYKMKGVEGQERRRQQILEDQERKREQLLDEHRKLVDSFPSGTKSPRRFRKMNFENTLMFSEWLMRPPEDLETNWLMKVCPMGRRCIVIAQKGETLVYSKQGKLLVSWQSQLPGGSSSNCRNATSTILDCIYSPNSNQIFILDVMHWGDLPLVGTEMSFRQFWIKSKLEETPELSTKSSNNKYTLVYLEAHNCSREGMEEAMANFPYFPGDVPEVDGILFYHRDAHYSAGRTPLVGWLKPWMLPEVLDIDINQKFFQSRPEDYKGYAHYMEEFDKQYANGRKKKVNDVEMENADEEKPNDMSEDEEDMEKAYEKLIAVEEEKG